MVFRINLYLDQSALDELKCMIDAFDALVKLDRRMDKSTRTSKRTGWSNEFLRKFDLSINLLIMFVKALRYEPHDRVDFMLEHFYIKMYNYQPSQTPYHYMEPEDRYLWREILRKKQTLKSYLNFYAGFL